VKLDKRKWALEVLARKTGSYERKTEASLGKMGSFPLLIQLPSDMRPILPHSSWAVINFSKFVPPQAVQNFANRLPELCKTYGVLMNPNLAAPPATEINGNVEGVVKHMTESAEKNGNPLELTLCIMPQQDNKHLYATVKRLCELEFGVWTQCCLADHVKKCKPEYIANVILKINAKLGGKNSLLVDEQKKSSQSCPNCSPTDAVESTCGTLLEESKFGNHSKNCRIRVCRCRCS
jgi:hypothetical protein